MDYVGIIIAVTLIISGMLNVFLLCTKPIDRIDQSDYNDD